MTSPFGPFIWGVFAYIIFESFVIAVSYIFLCTTVLTTATRLFTTIRRGLGFGGDDVSFLAAAVFAIVQSILVGKAAGSGLGKHIDKLDTAHISSYYKYVYAASIEGVISMACSKTTVVLLYQRLAPHIGFLQFGVLHAAVIAWTIFSIFGIAFQCGIPQPWVFHPLNCRIGANVNIAVVILNIFTDAAITIYILPTIWKLNVSRRTRLIVISSFGVRFCVCVVAVGQLAVLIPALSSRDQTWVNVLPVTLSIIVVHTSCITAAIPRIQSFLADIQSGRIGATVTAQEVELRDSRKGSRSNTKLSKFSSSKLSKFSNQSDHSLRLRPDDPSQISSHIYSVTEKETGKRKRSRTRKDSREDAASTKSTSNLKQNAVFHERDFVVEVEYLGSDGTSQRTTSESRTGSSRR